MSTKNSKARRRTNRGSALVEFALVMPLLFMLTMGATDFARVFFHAITIANAAGTGAFYGAQGNVNAANFGTMEARAKDDAINLENVTSDATQFCECPAADNSDFTSSATSISCDLAATPGSCAAGAYGLPAVYVRVDVLQDFKTLGPYPGIPEVTSLKRQAYMRVQ